MKQVATLTAADFRAHPVWRFCESDEPSETAVEPVRRFPVQSLDGSLAGCEVTLSSGKIVLGYLGNLDVDSPRTTEHFLTLSVWGDRGEIFHLSRYHDFDYSDSGPDALAAFLRMKKEEIFPISWDVRRLVCGAPSSACGQILSEPRERLSDDELMSLALP